MTVYFMRPIGMFGPIKIGCSSSPGARLRELMTWSPFELELLVTIPGDFDLEKKLHGRFAYLHRHGEWFNTDARLLGAIEALQRGEPLDRAIDLDLRTGSIRSGKSRRPRSENMKLRMYYLQRFNGRLRALKTTTGASMHAPVDVERIMDRWRGDWRDIDGTGIRPTTQEIARLDDFLANIATQAVTFEQWLVERQAA